MNICCCLLLISQKRKRFNCKQLNARLQIPRGGFRKHLQGIIVSEVTAGMHPKHGEACRRFNWPHSTLPPFELAAYTSNFLFPLLTKPLIHPETGGQVSAKAEKKMGDSSQEHLCKTAKVSVYKELQYALGFPKIIRRALLWHLLLLSICLKNVKSRVSSLSSNLAGVFKKKGI